VLASLYHPKPRNSFRKSVVSEKSCVVLGAVTAEEVVSNIRDATDI